MIIRNSFTVPLPPSDAWKVLLNVPDIVSCVPGAELIESTGDHRYVGRMKVKLGPIAVQFQGTIELEDIDPVQFRATAKAKGAEMKSRGAATAVTRFAVTPLPGEHSQVDIETDLALTGMVAQYGRGAGVISAVAQQIVDQFAACLARHVQSGKAETARVSAAESLAPEPQSVNALSLIARALLSWLRSLFGRRSDNRYGSPS